MRLLLALALALLAPSCSLFGEDDGFAEHHARWTRAGLDDYTYALTRSSAWFPPCRLVVTVRADTVAAATNPEPCGFAEQAPNFPEGWAMTVDDLFARLAQARADDYETIGVRYDRRLGYPRSIYLDASSGLADEEVSFAASDLNAD